MKWARYLVQAGYIDDHYWWRRRLTLLKEVTRTSPLFLITKLWGNHQSTHQTISQVNLRKFLFSKVFLHSAEPALVKTSSIRLTRTSLLVNLIIRELWSKFYWASVTRIHTPILSKHWNSTSPRRICLWICDSFERSCRLAHGNEIDGLPKVRQVERRCLVYLFPYSLFSWACLVLIEFGHPLFLERCTWTDIFHRLLYRISHGTSSSSCQFPQYCLFILS